MNIHTFVYIYIKFVFFLHARSYLKSRFLAHFRNTRMYIICMLLWILKLLFSLPVAVSAQSNRTIITAKKKKTEHLCHINLANQVWTYARDAQIARLFLTVQTFEIRMISHALLLMSKICQTLTIINEGIRFFFVYKIIGFFFVCCGFYCTKHFGLNLTQLP